MKRLVTAISAAVAGIMPAATAFAASGAREDNSGFFVWTFLVLCAMIVIGQLMPVFMVMAGFIKGLRKEVKTEA